MAGLTDPSDKALDAQADGNFGGKHSTNRRAGYSKTVTINGEEITELEWLIRRAKKDATLASGEGRKIIEHYEDEIVRLREQLRDAYTKEFHLGEKLSAVERERDQLIDLPAERILAALRQPSEAVVKAAWDLQESMYPKHADYGMVIRTAVAAAEKEASDA